MSKGRSQKPPWRTPTVEELPGQRMSVRPGRPLSVGLLDDKGEPTKVQPDVVEARFFTTEETRGWHAWIDAKLEAFRLGYENANSREDCALYVFSALNFCGGRPLPYWLLKAVTAMARSQLPATREEMVFLLSEHEMIRSLAAQYKANGVRNAKTEAEKDVAEIFGLSVEGLRKKRYRYRKALGIERGKQGRTRS